MGQYTIVIHGTGSHHNSKAPNDADVVAERAVAELRASGHFDVTGTITYGGREEVAKVPPVNVDKPDPQE